MSEENRVGGTLIVRVIIPEGYKPGDIIEAIVHLGDMALVEKVAAGSSLLPHS